MRSFCRRVRFCEKVTHERLCTFNYIGQIQFKTIMMPAAVGLG